jgi:hypothetical protein
MEEPIIKSLKSFQSVKPDEGFVRRSRDIILASEQNSARGFNIFESLKLAAALTMASALLFIAVGGASYFNLGTISPGTLSSLQAERQDVDFHIQLGQAEYDLEDEKTIGARIDEFLKKLSL